AVALQRRGAAGSPAGATTHVVGRLALELVVGQPALEREIVLARFPLGRHGEANAAILELNAGNRPGAAEAADKRADQRAPTREPNLEPGGVVTLGRMDGHVPATDDPGWFRPGGLVVPQREDCPHGWGENGRPQPRQKCPARTHRLLPCHFAAGPMAYNV